MPMRLEQLSLQAAHMPECKSVDTQLDIKTTGGKYQPLQVLICRSPQLLQWGVPLNGLSIADQVREANS